MSQMDHETDLDGQKVSLFLNGYQMIELDELCQVLSLRREDLLRSLVAKGLHDELAQQARSKESMR